MSIKKKSNSLWLPSGAVLLLLALHIESSNTQQQECCSSLQVSSSGPSSRFQSSRLGIYHQVGTLSNRPIYKNEKRNEYLFYLTTRSRGLWMIGPNPGSFNGGIANRADQACVENIPAESWKYADGSGWKKDSELNFECHYNPTECLYSDDSVLEGGDLYPNRVRFVSGTFECIRLCSSTPGCQYWTVDKLMNETRHVCNLKAWKGELVPKRGYVSGSLPKACHESAESSSPVTPSSKSQVPLSSDDNACVYRNLEFEGGDLRLLQNVSSFSECRMKCSEYIECSLFSYHVLKRECRLKSNQVSVRRNLRVSSGASIKTCKQVLSLKKRKQFFGRSKSEFKKYEDNEINGQFRITSEQWNPELENPASNSFQEMSSTIKDSLLEMIMEDSAIRDKAKFDITIVGFSPGSVICNFKINYILKEAYVAIPFIIKPKNVTNALLNNFKFKKGILFQRFVIASGSFKASSPVDHCDAMGCSHKCTYDYALQDYRCICPPGLYLDGDNKNCVEESLTTTTTPSSITEDDSELPENCLLSPWTRWSRCTATCGPATRSRARVVILPSKNGGSCDGELREEKPCNLPACPGSEIQDDEDDNTVTEATIFDSSREIDNAEAVNFEALKALAPIINSIFRANGVPYFKAQGKTYFVKDGKTRVLPGSDGAQRIKYTYPNGSEDEFELTNVDGDAPFETSFKLVQPQSISLADLMRQINDVYNYYTLNGIVYFIINGIPYSIRDGKTEVVQDEDSGVPQIKYTYPEGRMSFIRLSKFNPNESGEEDIQNNPIEISVDELENNLEDIEFYLIEDRVPYFFIKGRPYIISPGSTEIVPSSEDGVYFIRVVMPDNSVSEIEILNDTPLTSASPVPTIHSLSQNSPEIVDIQMLEKLIPEVSGFYFIGSTPYFFVKGKPYKVEPGKTEIVYGPKGLASQIKNTKPDGTVYTIDLGSRAITPITTQTTVTPRLEDDSSSAIPPNQEDVSILSQKVPKEVTIQELEQLLPDISAYFEINSEPRFVINNTPYVVAPGTTKVIPGDENSSPTISYTYPNGTTYDIKLGGSSVPSGSAAVDPTGSSETITIDELENLIPQMTAYYVRGGTPFFVINGKSYKIEPGTTEIIQDENSPALTVKHTFPNGTVYEIKLGSSEEGQDVSTTPVPVTRLDHKNAKKITIEELEKRISEVTGYFVKDGITYFVINGAAYVVEPGKTTITKGAKDNALVIRHIYPNGTIYEINIENSQASHEIQDNAISLGKVEDISIEELEKLVPQITGYYVLNGIPYFVVGDTPYRVSAGKTEVIPNEQDSSLTVRHTRPDGRIYEIHLGNKPKIQVQPATSTKGDPSSQYGEPEVITFEQLRELLPGFSGYYVKDGVTYFIIGKKAYKVEPGTTEVVPDDENSLILVKYTHPDGTKSELQLATHSDDKEPTPIKINDFENLLSELSGYYVKNGIPHFVIKDTPYVISDGETEIITKEPDSPFIIRHTFPNGTIYDINVGLSSTELPPGSSIPSQAEPVVITIDELKKLIPKVTGYYVKDGVTYFMINDVPHRVEPGVTNIKKSENGALIIQHENANGTTEEIKLSKEPEQVKTITIDELKNLLPQLTGYYIKDGTPYFIIDDMTYVVSPGTTEVIKGDDGSSFIVKNISPDGLVTEINLEKPLKQQEKPLTPDQSKVLTIDELEKDIRKITGYYIRDGVPYFIIDGTPYKVSPGKTEIIENKEDKRQPLIIRHERPDGSIHEIQLGTAANDSPLTEDFDRITFDDFEKDVQKVTGYFIKNGEPFFIIDGRTKKIEPGTTSLAQDETNQIIKIVHRYPDGRVKEIELSTKSVKETEEKTTISPLQPGDDKTEDEAQVIKSVETTATERPESGIQFDDDKIDTTTTPFIEELVEEITIDDLIKDIADLEKYIIRNGVPYFYFNGVPKKVNSGITEIVPKPEDGTFLIKHTTPEGEVKEIKYSPKPTVDTPASTTASPDSIKTTSFATDSTSTISPVAEVNEISFDDFEKEVPNVSEYYVKDNVPYFVINGKPTKIEDGLTEVTPNEDDGSITVTHTYPDGSGKQITLSAQPLQTTQGITTTVSVGDTTPIPVSVEMTTTYEEFTSTPDIITFEDLVKELPKVTRYYIRQGVPYFVINGKPHKVDSGVTQVEPNEDGTISIVNISPDGSTKEAKFSSDQLKEEEIIDENKPNLISFDDLLKELPKVTRYYIIRGVPYFVINRKPYRVESGTTEVRPNGDGTISIINISPDGSVKEGKVSSDQLKEEDVVDVKRPEIISFDDLVKELPRVTRYYIKKGVPYFVINRRPYKVESGVTQVKPNEDGTITITNIQPDGSRKEAKVSSDQLKEEEVVDVKRPERISFDDLVKELPKVTRYYIRHGVPYFVINGKPYQVDSGVTQVKPNDDDTISITNIAPDGAFKEVKIPSEQVVEDETTPTSVGQTTPSSFGETTLGSIDEATHDSIGETTTLSDGKTTPVPGEVEVTTTLGESSTTISQDEAPEMISFEDLVKELPKVTRYYVRKGVPYFVINGKPYQVDSGVTQVKPNDDGTISIVNITPEGLPQEVKIPSDQVVEDKHFETTPADVYSTTSPEVTTTFKTVTPSTESVETTMKEGIIKDQDETPQPGLTSADKITFEELEKELPNVTGYFEKDGETYFIINGKPKQVMSGETSVVPNEEDGSITITQTLPDGSVKEIVMTAEPIKEESFTTTPSSIYSTEKASTDTLTTLPDVSSMTSLNMSTPNTVISDITQKDAQPITFKELKSLVPDISAYYVIDDIPYFVISGVPYYVSDGVTRLIPGEGTSPFIIKSVNSLGEVDEIALGNYEIVPGTVETGPNLAISTTESPVPSSSSHPVPIPISLEELEKLIPMLNSYYVLNGVTYFVIGGNKVYYVEDGSTSISQGAEPDSLAVMHIFPNGTLYEIHLGSDRFSKKPINTTIEELEKILYDIKGYYVINDTPYFIINDMTYYVDTGKTMLIPGSNEGPFTIHHIFPNGTVYDIVLGDFKIKDEDDQVTTTSNIGSTTLSTLDASTTTPSSVFADTTIPLRDSHDQDTTIAPVSYDDDNDESDSFTTKVSEETTLAPEVTKISEQQQTTPSNQEAKETTLGFDELSTKTTQSIDEDSFGTTPSTEEAKETTTLATEVIQEGSVETTPSTEEVKEGTLNFKDSSVETTPSTEEDQRTTLATEIIKEDSVGTTPSTEMVQETTLVSKELEEGYVKTTPSTEDGEVTTLVTEDVKEVTTQSTPLDDDSGVEYAETTPSIGEATEEVRETTPSTEEVKDTTPTTQDVEDVTTQTASLDNDAVFGSTTPSSEDVKEDSDSTVTTQTTLEEDSVTATTNAPVTNIDGDFDSTTPKTPETEGITIEELEFLIPKIKAYKVINDVPYFSADDKLYFVNEGKTLIMPGNDNAPFMIRHVYENGTEYDFDFGSFKVSPEDDLTTTTKSVPTLDDDTDAPTTTESSVIDLIKLTTSKVDSTTEKQLDETTISDESQSTSDTVSTTIINFITSTMKPFFQLGGEDSTKAPEVETTTATPIEENVFTVLPTGLITPNETFIDTSSKESSEASTETTSVKKEEENIFTVLPVDIDSVTTEVNVKNIPTDEEFATETTPSVLQDNQKKPPSPIGGVSLTTGSETTTESLLSTDDLATTSEPVTGTTVEGSYAESTTIPSITHDEVEEEAKETQTEVAPSDSTTTFGESITTEVPENKDVFTVLPTDPALVDETVQFDDEDEKDVESIGTTSTTPELTTTLSPVDGLEGGVTKSTEEKESVFTVLPSNDLPSGYTPSTVIDLTTLVTTKASVISTTDKPTSQDDAILDLTTMKTTVVSKSGEDVVISTTTISPDVTTTTTTTTTTTPSSLAQTQDEGTHTLNCQVTAESCNNPDPTVPLNCKTGNSQPITVLINKKDINLQEVVDKNLKIIVKEFMLMPMMMPSNADASKRR